MQRESEHAFQLHIYLNAWKIARFFLFLNFSSQVPVIYNKKIFCFGEQAYFCINKPTKPPHTVLQSQLNISNMFIPRISFFCCVVSLHLGHLFQFRKAFNSDQEIIHCNTNKVRLKNRRQKCSKIILSRAKNEQQREEPNCGAHSGVPGIEAVFKCRRYPSGPKVMN